MQKLGTTNEGGVFVALTAAEMQTIGRVLELLNGIVADPILTPTNEAPRAAPGGGTGQGSRTGQPRARPPTAQGVDGMKTCSACHQEKPSDEFYRGHGRCKHCTLAAQKAAKAAKRGKASPTAAPASGEPVEPANKTCTRCKQERPQSSFGPWQRVCNECKSDGILNRAARPTPTKEERRRMISEAAHRIREREDTDIPREGGRALPVGSSD